MSKRNMRKTFAEMCQAQAQTEEKVDLKTRERKYRAVERSGEKKARMESTKLTGQLKGEMKFKEAEILEAERDRRLARVRQEIARTGVTGASVEEVMKNLGLTCKRSDAFIRRLVWDRRDFSVQFGHLPFEEDEASAAAKHYVSVTENEDLKEEFRKLFGWNDDKVDGEEVSAPAPGADESKTGQTAHPKTRPDDGSGSGEKISWRWNLGVDGLSAAA